MKTGQPTSKAVVVLAALVIVISLGLGWFATRHRAAKPTVPVDTTDVAETPPPTAAESPAALPLVPVRHGELPPVVPVSLVPLLVSAENDQWSKSEPFISMPRGTQSFGGIEFWIDGMLQLQSQSAIDDKRTYRDRITLPLLLTNTIDGAVVDNTTNGVSVHLLGATRYGGEGEASVAELVWRYADGKSRRTPIRFGNQVRDWVRLSYETPATLPYPFSKVIWNKKLTGGRSDRLARLYRISYPNPEPTKPVRQLELVSSLGVQSLFVIGLTLDPVKLGERPDDSLNLEPTDAVPPNQIQLHVQTTEGQPIANAKVRVLAMSANRSAVRFDRTQTADANGLAVVYYPPTDVDRLEVSAAHDDYGNRKMVWAAGGGEVVPASYILKLSGGITIGGTVVDASENPIATAKINLSRFWSGGEEMNKKGEQANFSTQTLRTDPDGRWQAKGVPAELLDHISLGATHPDFVDGGGVVLGRDATTDSKLRAGTHKIVLQRGLIVRGKVIDEQDKPISGARVWSGRMNFQGTRDVTTDAQGTFTFLNSKGGEQSFSVLAKGRKPMVKNVTVKADMDVIIFKLVPGKLIHGIVKNDAGEPVSGVRLSLEDSMGGVSQDYQFDMTSDKDGHFEWDGAPDEERTFAVLKTGYEAKRRHRLKIDTENIVTLRKNRKVQGWVIDAETEKPITKFRASIGSYHGEDSFYPDYPGLKDFSNANGEFTLEITDEQKNGIKAEADEYAGKAQSLPAGENGVIQVTLRLKPSAALRGVLVAADGAPVPGATVAITSGNSGPGAMRVTLSNGRLSTYGDRSKIATTDASGQFVLPSPPETGLVAAAAEKGFAIAPLEQVRSSGRLVLQAYGQIEGTFKVAGQPVAGQEFLFSLMNQGISPEFNSFKATTDEAGRFNILKVPPGEGQIVRLIKTTPNSWSHSHSTDIVVKSGETTSITLGDSGAVLKGKVTFETPPAEDQKLIISGSLNSPMPAPPQNLTPEEIRAYYQSAEWKELTKQRKNYSVSVNTDGTWNIDSIPPGTYTLNLSASESGTRPWEKPPIARGSTTVTVPDNATPFTPITLNEIILKPLPKPKTVPSFPKP